MATPAGETVVRIWTNDVSPVEARAYEARLRDTELPRLRKISGHAGSQLLRSEHDGTVRFTVISHWQPGAESTMRRITGELSSAGQSTVERVLDGRPVDVVLGETVSVDSVAPAPQARRRDLTTVLALGVVAAVLVASLGRRDAEPAARGDSTDPPPATSSVEVETTIPEPFIPWPDPPEDHDPHVIGRPGPGAPVAPELDGQTLVYVNERLRPTVVDLSTGDQRELDIAETRVAERFLLENGRIVVTDVLDPDFPISAGQAFVFQVVVDGAAAVDAGPVPTLCLTPAAACADRPWTSGSFGDQERGASSLDGPPSAAIAAHLGSITWSQSARWTTFELDAEMGSLRVPTPASHSVVWLVTEPV